MAFADKSNMVHVRRLGTGERRELGRPGAIRALALAPDGRALVAFGRESGDAGASVLWKWDLSRPAAAPQRILLWAAEDSLAVSGRKQEDLGVGEPEFSPDLLRLVFRNDDVAEIWDVESGSRLGSLPLPNEYAELAFSADGHHLLILDDDRLLKIAIADADLRRRACDVAGRPLTESEVTRYLGGRRDVRPCTAMR